MTVKSFLKKYILNNILVMLFWLALIAFAFWVIWTTYGSLFSSSNALRNSIKLLISGSVLVFVGVLRLIKITPMILDTICKCKTKKIEFFVENMFLEKFDLANIYSYVIKAKLSNKKTATLMYSRKICKENIEKGFYYTATVTKYSNTVIELIKGKETKGNFQK